MTLSSSGIVRSRDKLKLLNLHYQRVSMTAKLSKMVIYLDGVLPIKSYDPLIT